MGNNLTNQQERIVKLPRHFNNRLNQEKLGKIYKDLLQNSNFKEKLQPPSHDFQLFLRQISQLVITADQLEFVSSVIGKQLGEDVRDYIRLGYRRKNNTIALGRLCCSGNHDEIKRMQRFSTQREIADIPLLLRYRLNEAKLSAILADLRQTDRSVWPKEEGDDVFQRLQVSLSDFSMFFRQLAELATNKHRLKLIGDILNKQLPTGEEDEAETRPSKMPQTTTFASLVLTKQQIINTAKIYSRDTLNETALTAILADLKQADRGKWTSEESDQIFQQLESSLNKPSAFFVKLSEHVSQKPKAIKYILDLCHVHLQQNNRRTQLLSSSKSFQQESGKFYSQTLKSSKTSNNIFQQEGDTDEAKTRTAAINDDSSQITTWRLLRSTPSAGNQQQAPAITLPYPSEKAPRIFLVSPLLSEKFVAKKRFQPYSSIDGDDDIDEELAKEEIPRPSLSFQETGRKTCPTTVFSSEDGCAAIGIDFGTCMIRIAVVLENKKVTILNNEFERSSTPNVLSYCSQDGKPPAVVGDEALEMGSINPRHCLMELRRLVRKCSLDESGYPVRQYKDWTGIERKIPATEIFATVLAKLRMEAALKIEKDVRCAVISVPTDFAPLERKTLILGALSAGFSDVRLRDETTLGALAFLRTSCEFNGGKILVLCFGGGNCEASVVEVKKNHLTVLSSVGSLSLGGLEFDRRMVSFCLLKLRCDSNIHISPTDQRAIWALRTGCERAKFLLSCGSTGAKTRIKFEGEDSNDYWISIDRATFERECSDLFDRVDLLMKDVLTKSRLPNAKEQIRDAVLLGGSCRMPKVAELLRENLSPNVRIHYSVSYDEAVVEGAALQASFLDQKSDEIDNFVVKQMCGFDLTLSSSTAGQSVFLEREQPPLEVKGKVAYANLPVDANLMVNVKTTGSPNKFIASSEFGMPLRKITHAGETKVTISIDDSKVLHISGECNKNEDDADDQQQQQLRRDVEEKLKSLFAAYQNKQPKTK